MPQSQAAALVIGFSIQGLAIARALSRRGIPVYALERNRRIPSVRTRYAKVMFTDRIHGRDLIETLKEIRSTLPHDEVVLFAASDKTVRAVGQFWAELAPFYRLSWEQSAGLVLDLSVKSNLPALCEAAGVAYPKTRVIGTEQDLWLAESLRPPLIVKPASPPGPFKAVVVQNMDGLRKLLDAHPGTRPLVVQEWIEGGDETLYFCTLFMDRGRELARFTGRKIRSSPTGLGRGVVFETHWEPPIYEASRRFVSQLDLCGLISLEFKRDPHGHFWFIEPNAGRTEYCVDMVLQGGVDVAYLEFCYALGRSVEPGPDRDPSLWREVVWCDTEREPFCYWSLVLHERSFRPHGKRPVFPFLGHRDPMPVVWAGAQLLRNMGRSAIGRITRALGRPGRVAPIATE